MTRWLVLASSAWLVALVTVTAQPARPAYPGTIDQHPAIDYLGTPASDLVARVGSGGLTFDGAQGYLRSVLARLDVPVESQLLLFSKTGIQHPFTNPSNPRALYFNDQVVVGYIPGAPILEIASHDPRQGVIFYSLNQDPVATPSFRRVTVCLSCHLSMNSLEVPGLLVRSMFTTPEGRTMPQLGSFLTDHRSPLERRWGGWYVTGTHGAMRHMGNAMVSDPSQPALSINETTLNRGLLAPQVDTVLYPATTSDIVALLVFDHQGRAVNLLTRLGWEARMAKAESRLDFQTGALGDLVRETVDYLLFVDEAPLTAPVQGAPGFVKAFSAAGPRDAKGRHLRELDLSTRLLRYRCSHMIYSPAFDALPDEARAALFGRMKDILFGRDRDSRYGVVSGADRQALAEILGDTLRGWR